MHRGLSLLCFLFSAQIVFASDDATYECQPDIVHFQTDSQVNSFATEIADTLLERNKGLMFREELAKDQGMLFVYERPQSVSFWMRNTLIPLDIIFMDQSGTVRSIAHDAIPLDETSLFGGRYIQYVFEINAGLARNLNIKIGSKMRHPLVNQKIAGWPC